MAKRFDFKDNTVELNIAGNIFNVDPTNADFVEKAVKVADNSVNMFNKTKSEELTAETIEKMIKEVLNMIDELLGENASNKIFANRTINMLDVIDVLDFIVQETTSTVDSKLSRYTIDRIK